MPVREHLPRTEDEPVHRVDGEAEVRDLALLEGGVGGPERTAERRGVRRDEDRQRVHRSGAGERGPTDTIAEPAGGTQLRHPGSEEERVPDGH